jgi:V8-like Glu-specific endopeptidase
VRSEAKLIQWALIFLLIVGIGEPVSAGTDLRSTCNKPVYDALTQAGYTRNEIRHFCIESSQDTWGSPNNSSSDEIAHSVSIDSGVDAETAYKKGIAYRYGRGVRSDLDLSAKWLEFSAARGHIAAQVAIADAYRLGQGEDVDVRLARQWYQKAALQGSAEAAFDILGMEYRGEIAALPSADTLALQEQVKKSSMEPLPTVAWKFKACGAEQRTYWAVAGYSKGQIEYECWAGWSAVGNLAWASNGGELFRQLDGRFEVDRLSVSRKGVFGAHPVNNVKLNGIGVVEIPAKQMGTGFLLDQCHVLTNQHVAYGRQANPPAGQRVTFWVGQASPGSTAGSYGMRFQYQGAVIRSGGTIDRVPGGVAISKATDLDLAQTGNDWAVVKLDSDVDPALPFMSLRADPVELTGATLFTSGFPADRNNNFKPGSAVRMWGSSGDLIRLIPGDGGEAVILSLLQTNDGQSGSPVYIAKSGQQQRKTDFLSNIPDYIEYNGPLEQATEFTAVGMISSGDLDDAQATLADPTYAMLFTPNALQRIHEAVTSSPCR